MDRSVPSCICLHVSVPALRHAARLDDVVIAVSKAVRAQHVEQDKRVAGGPRIDRQHFAFEIAEILDSRPLTKLKKATVAAHERKEFRLRSDRRISLPSI